MTTFQESDHPRSGDGRFAASSSSESSAVLEEAPAAAGRHDEHTRGIPGVDGRPFAEVFAEHFKPLDDFESEHGEYAPAERVTAERLMEYAGLAGRNFGRLRGVSVEMRTNEWTEEKTGPFLVVHTRNGSGNREHYGEDTEPGPACDCTGCVQTYQIPGYPGYVDDEDDDGDYTYANNFFELPTLPPDGDYPTDTAQRLQLDELKRARELVQTGALRPWHFLARRTDRDPKQRWWPGFSQPSDLQRATRERDSVLEQLQAEQQAFATATPPAVRPTVRTKAKIGSRGQTLRTRQPIRVPRFSIAKKELDQAAADLAEHERKKAELDATLTMASLPPAAADVIRKERESLAKYADRSRTAAFDDAQYRHDMAWFEAANTIASLSDLAQRQSERVERLTVAERRDSDYNWRNWPGDRDSYERWNANHGLTENGEKP